MARSGTLCRSVMRYPLHVLKESFGIRSKSLRTPTIRCATPIRCMTDSSNAKPNPVLQEIIDKIASLNLLEAVELSELLKEVAFTAQAPSPAPVTESKEAEKEPEKLKEISVVLKSFDPARKANIIKEVRGFVKGMTLAEVKKFVESSPCVIEKGCTKERADTIVEKLTGTGAVVEIE